MQSTFATSAWLSTQRALAYYHLREFESAMQIFEDLQAREPERLDDLVPYSNILYVLEEGAKLSLLAHRACQVDRYRPETACIVGNYYRFVFVTNFFF